MKHSFQLTLTVIAVLAIGSAARADFSGQTILGPLGVGSSVNGDTTNSTDDNDGEFSGVFSLDWTGPDDVWQLDWTGGDMQLDLLFSHAEGDLDLFLYVPGQLAFSSQESETTTDNEAIFKPAAAAGTYYVLVDGYDFAAAAYTLNVTPEPATLSLLALGGLMLLRRR